MKKQLIASIAAKLQSFGYTVYIAENGEYGFYTNGTRCVSFGGQWRWSVDFGGNYRAKTDGGARTMGTGWQIAKEKGDISEHDAKCMIEAGAPQWATKGNAFDYTTPQMYLNTYGKSSGFRLFGSPELVHYGLTREERASNAGKHPSCFDNRQAAACGNGSYWAELTRNKNEVTCDACKARI